MKLSDSSGVPGSRLGSGVTGARETGDGRWGRGGASIRERLVRGGGSRCGGVSWGMLRAIGANSGRSKKVGVHMANGFSECGISSRSGSA